VIYWSLGICALVGVVAWLLVYVIRRWAERRQVFDIPNHRSSHTRPVARGGGLAIAFVGIATWLVVLFLHPDENIFGMFCFGVGALLIAGISFVDDLHAISSTLRFSVHGAAAVLLLLGYGSWSVIAIPLAGDVAIAWLGIPLAFVWIVGLTNAYNFMDGIDGIAAVQAIIAGAGWFVIGHIEGQSESAWLGLSLAASSAGFLIHNWSPARIFMGDVGSAFLGFSFAFLAVKAGRENPRLVVAGVLLVWPFVFDATFTFLRRLKNRENVFAAHRSHLYQRLVIAGWSHAAATTLYGALDLLGAILAVAYAKGCLASDWLVATGVPVLACGLWLLVVRQEGRRKGVVSRSYSP